jgi:hypothetical protein
MIGAPNELRERGFESPPPRRALDTGLQQSTLVRVAPRFAVVTTRFDGFFERAGTHETTD